jgi:23S rRNA (pseudouridine1915-N3)-methyltransferase
MKHFLVFLLLTMFPAVVRCYHFPGAAIKPFHQFRSKLFYTTHIYIVGKRNGGEEWIHAGCNEYEKRLTPIMKFQTHFFKSDEELIASVKSITKGSIFCMDEKGTMHDSNAFSRLLYKGYEDGRSTVSFVVGGFAGLPQEIRAHYPLISLSKMTFTHQMARLLLLEQIYRATEIKKGSSYHKE